MYFVCSGLANSEHSHPAGLLLKTSILLQHDGSSERLNHGEYVCVLVCGVHVYMYVFMFFYCM